MLMWRLVEVGERQLERMYPTMVVTVDDVNQNHLAPRPRHFPPLSPAMATHDLFAVRR